MRHRDLASIGVGAAVIALILLAPSHVAGQTPAAASKASAPSRPAKAWTPPRTSWGDPDLQGIWTNATITPFERPAALAAKPFLTEEEAAALEKQTAQRREAADRSPRRGDVGSYNEFWFDQGTKVVANRRTSLVVDPPDGRVPVLPSAEERRDAYLARSGDSYAYMSVWDRCISRGVPGSMFPAGYNNAYQILQTPGYVVILYEMIHDARIIPLDGRPRPPQNVRSWMGDARGRWDGDTLIVETTNFHDRGWIASSAAGGRIKGIPHSEALHVVERFRLADPDTISYEVTIEDPPVYSRSWTVAMPLNRDQDYRIFEYACHEGNKAVPNILSGARAQERVAADAEKPKPRTPPRTPDGQPDLQGIWDFRSATPLERPREFSGKEFLTVEEAVEYEQRADQRDDGRPPGDSRTDPSVHPAWWLDYGKKVVGTRRTSLIVDPPDGRVPPLTPEARERQTARAQARRGRGPADSFEDRSLFERCITRGLPAGMLPGAYNNNVQILQTPGYVVIFTEMIHDARIVPMDGRPPLPQHLRLWMGASRGRWEGDTLVVETTNFSDKTNFRGSGANLRLVERFTRVDANTIEYQFTVDDPTTWTRPWTVAFPMVKSEGPIYEYACHEGNYAIGNMLRGARQAEQAAAQGKR